MAASAKMLVAAGAVLLLVIAWTFSGMLSNDFVFFDDDGYVFLNPAVNAGFTLDSVRYAFTTFDLGNWIPVTWLSYLLDAEFRGLQAAGFHWTNLSLHCLNSLLLFLFLYSATGSIGRSWCVAMIWGLHPLRVESVAWIAERKDVLSSLFLLLTLLAWLRFRQSHSRVWYAVSCLMFAIGLLSKSMLVTLPVLLMILDFWPFNAQRSGDQQRGDQIRPAERKTPWVWVFSELRQKAVLLLMALAIGLVTIRAQESFAAMVSLEIYSVADRLFQSIAAAGWYATHFLAPLGLGPYYPLAPGERDWFHFTAGLVIIFGAVFWSSKRFRSAPWVAVGFGWAFVSLLPVIGLIRVGEQAYADRYTYIPMMGFTWIAVWESAELVQWLIRRNFLQRPLAAHSLLVVITMLPLAALTIVQIEYWHDARSLWTRAIQLDDSNWLAHFHLGRQALRDNDAATASEHFALSMQQRPGYVDAYLMLAALHQNQNRLETAEQIYLAALKLSPGQPEATFNLGVIARMQGRNDDAMRWFAQCNQDGVQARVELELGQVAAQQNQFETAIRHFGNAVDANPMLEAGYEFAAAVSEQSGRIEDAMSWLDRGLAKSPGSLRLQIQRARLLHLGGNQTEAMDELQKLLKAHPSHPGLMALIRDLSQAETDSK